MLVFTVLQTAHVRGIRSPSFWRLFLRLKWLLLVSNRKECLKQVAYGL